MENNNKYLAHIKIIIISLLTIIIWSLIYEYLFKQYSGTKIYWFIGATIALAAINKRNYVSSKKILTTQIITSLLFFLIYNWSIYYSTQNNSENLFINIFLGKIGWNSHSSIGYFLNLTIYDFIAFVIFAFSVFLLSLYDINRLNSHLNPKSIFNINNKYGFVPILLTLIVYSIISNILYSVEYKFYYESLSTNELEFWPRPSNIDNFIATIEDIIMVSIQVLSLYYFMIKKKITPLKTLLLLFGIVFFILFTHYLFFNGFDIYAPNYVLGLTINKILTLALLLILSKEVKVIFAIPITFLLIYIYNKIIFLFIFVSKDIYKVLIHRYELILIPIVSGLISGVIYYYLSQRNISLNNK